MKECVCRTCGKKFTARNVNGVYCSAACRKKGENWKEREKRAKEAEEKAKIRGKPKMSIEEVLAIGRRHGMYRYGDIVAKIEAGVIS